VPQAEINAPVNRVVTVLVVAMAALLVVTILISVIVGGYIVKPLIGVVAVADRVAAGDLSVDIDVKRKDEIGKLTESMKTMVGSLRSKGQSLERMAQKDLTVEIERASADDSLANSMVIMRDSLRSVLTEVQTAVDQVAAGSDQVSNASVALSQGATESASSLEEISSSVNQINGQARQNAEHATEAFGIAQQAASGADAGNAKMHQLQEAMTSISGSAEEINKIVKTIDDIAFQINLLALNANVEAARAGKYGKGFAVVAEEVRNLAVRSADAVKETSSVVEESLRNIGNGQELSEQTAEQLREITDGAGKVATFLQEIADASKEQSLAIEQVTEGLGQVDEVTQSNTASAEESASASEELASQAQILKRSVSEFRLSRNGAGHSDAGASLASPEKADETHEDRPAREKSAEPLRLK
jgi:methyl-accepting chemotaxis protein